MCVLEMRELMVRLSGTAMCLWAMAAVGDDESIVLVDVEGKDGPM